MSEYFPKLKSLGANVKFVFDLSNYATKIVFKNAIGVTLDFAKKTDLVNLKSDVDKLDIDKLKNERSGWSNLKSKDDKLDIGKLETTPLYLSKLSHAIKNDVVKKAKYNKLIGKVNTVQITDISNLVKKKLIMIQKLKTLKTKSQIMVKINILLLKN